MSQINTFQREREARGWYQGEVAIRMLVQLRELALVEAGIQTPSDWFKERAVALFELPEHVLFPPNEEYVDEVSSRMLPVPVIAQRALAALRERGSLSITELYAVLHRNVTAADLRAALVGLEQQGLARNEMHEPDRTVWSIVKPEEVRDE